jgi:hypothetical protein
VLFGDLVERPLVATFDQPHASSDGGAILLKAADRHLGLLAALTATVPDGRVPARVTHGVGDLVAQRVFAIACGHPDGNDGDRLADDPIHKLLLGRDPIAGSRLASQPTISRFEHTAAPRMLLAMSHALADTVIARHRRRRRGVRLITIDLDVTEDQTHGAQQLTFFNGFYDHWCYLPLVGTLTFDDEAPRANNLRDNLPREISVGAGRCQDLEEHVPEGAGGPVARGRAGAGGRRAKRGGP